MIGLRWETCASHASHRQIPTAWSVATAVRNLMFRIYTHREAAHLGHCQRHWLQVLLGVTWRVERAVRLLYSGDECPTNAKPQVHEDLGGW